MGKLARRLPVHRQIALVVGLFYYVASFVILRDVLFGIPAVFDGTKVVNGDELVPYFNPRSQLLEQAAGEFNQLTHGYEFRVRYSFLTTWVRHYKVLPFALLLGLPTITFSAYLTVAWFIRRTFTSLAPSTVALSCGFPIAFIYGIMVYAKITHFYTLIFGLCMMMISALTMLYALIFRRERWVRWVVLSSVVSLLNPAVHYLILFCLFFGLTCVTLAAGEFSRWIRGGGPRRLLRRRPRDLVTLVQWPNRWVRTRAWLREFANTTVGRCVVAGGVLLVVTLIPYALFVKFVALRGVGDLAQTVPGDYYFIRDASVSLLHIISWDLAGIMDKILFGDYLARVPRVANIGYTLLAFAPLLVPGVRGSLFRYRPHRQLLGVLYVNVGFAIWATVGYGEPNWFPTFHRSLAAVTKALYETETPVGEAALSISSTIVQVLRFPHRFQLILFMVAPLIMSLFLAWLLDRAMGTYGLSSAAGRLLDAGPVLVVRIAVTVAIGTVFFLPFFANTPYRTVFGSGNMAHFVTPYPVEDLAEVKEQLLALPEGKTAVFPPTETSKLVVDPNGAPHKFIDKFYIYYLDRPSYYYGLTGDAQNKFEFFLIMRGLYYQQDWWINIARDIDLEYIVLNKQIQNNRGIGAEYLPEIELYLRAQLEAQPDHVEQLFENDSYVLYRLDIERRPEAERDVLLFSASWSEFLASVFTRLNLSRCYDFQYVTNFEGPPDDGRQVHLVATDLTGAYYDLWAKQNAEYFFGASSKIFAFDPNIVSSNYYLSPMFRLYLFFSDTKWNRTEVITPGLFGTLDNQFVATPRATRLTVPMTLPDSGRYRMVMRGAATANELSIESPSMNYASTIEVRSPSDALELIAEETIYGSNRRAVDVSNSTVEELESRLSEDLIPVNARYVYFDLGVVDVEAGSHVVEINKLDDNPMLFEGLLLVPEDADVTEAAKSVNIIDSVRDLDCSEETEVRVGPRDPYVSVRPATGGEHAELTEEQLWELIGIDDLLTAEADGLGSRWVHFAMTILVLGVCIGIVRRRAKAAVDSLFDAHPELGVLRPPNGDTGTVSPPLVDPPSDPVTALGTAASPPSRGAGLAPPDASSVVVAPPVSNPGVVRGRPTHLQKSGKLLAATREEYRSLDRDLARWSYRLDEVERRLRGEAAPGQAGRPRGSGPDGGVVGDSSQAPH